MQFAGFIVVDDVEDVEEVEDVPHRHGSSVVLEDVEEGFGVVEDELVVVVVVVVDDDDDELDDVDVPVHAFELKSHEDPFQIKIHEPPQRLGPGVVVGGTTGEKVVVDEGFIGLKLVAICGSSSTYISPNVS